MGTCQGLINLTVPTGAGRWRNVRSGLGWSGPRRLGTRISLGRRAFLFIRIRADGKLEWEVLFVVREFGDDRVVFCRRICEKVLKVFSCRIPRKVRGFSARTERDGL